MYVLTYAGNVIHDPREESVQISAGKLVEESGQSPTLSFTVQPTHPFWSSFNRSAVMNTECEVELTEHETQKILFRGRIRKLSMSMNGAVNVTCEGAMAYLNDTTVRPYKTYDTDEIDCEINAPAKAGELFEWFVEQHNSRVSNRCEKFKVGINAGINFGTLQRGTGTRPTTLKEMREKLTKLCGGYFCVRYVGEDNYLDWLNADGSSEAIQTVELGKNLLSLNTGADGKDIYTAIVPVGKTGEGEDEKDVTIDDEHAYVGGGYDIVGDAVVDTTMAARYGVIEKLMEYDHLNQPQALADKAVADLASGKLDDSIKVSATDLHYADETIPQIDYLQRVQVTSEPHGIDRMMLCVGRTINLVDPKATKYSFGAIEGTLTKSGTVSQGRTQEATEKRLTALASTTRKTVEDTHKTTVKVQAVEEKAVAVEKKADAATEKIADVATTATAAAKKVDTVAAKAEKAAEEVSHVATDAKEANTAAKEAKTMATKAQSDTNEVKNTVVNLTNAFSHDTNGAHVGDKSGMHTTIDAQGMHVMHGAKEVSSISADTVELAKNVQGSTKAFVKMCNGSFILTAKQEQDEVIGDYQKSIISSDWLEFDVKKDFEVVAGRVGFYIKNTSGVANIGFDNEELWLDVNNGKSSNGVNIDLNQLVNLLTVTPWVTMRVTDGSNVIPRAYVKWRIYGGFLLFDVYVPAGYTGVHTVEKLPDKWKPSDSKYVVLATQQAEGTAGIWVDGVGGSYGDIWVYNSSSGYCSGLCPVIPKAFE